MFLLHTAYKDPFKYQNIEAENVFSSKLEVNTHVLNRSVELGSNVLTSLQLTSHNISWIFGPLLLTELIKVFFPAS